MTTLKQFLEDEGYTLTGSIRCAVRRWLEQKRKISEEYTTPINHEAIIDYLLEELKE